MRPERLGAWGVVVAAAAFQATAHAQVPNTERLRTAADEFDSGRRSYQLRDFEGAAAHFENADRDLPSADALFAAIRSRYEAGQLARAATLASSGVVRYPQDKAITNYAKRILPEAEKRLHKLVVKCKPECTAVLDGKLVPVAVSENATLYLDAGKHAVVAGWSSDRYISRDVWAVTGGTTELELEAPTKPEEQGRKPASGWSSAEGTTTDTIEGARHEAATGGLPPTVFWVGAGMTAVLAGLSIWSGVDTIQNPGTQTVKDACEAHSVDCQSLYDRGVAHQDRTNGLLVGMAGVGIATGIVGLFFTDWSGHPKRTESAQSLVPVVAIGGGLTVGARGRF